MTIQTLEFLINKEDNYTSLVIAYLFLSILLVLFLSLPTMPFLITSKMEGVSWLEILPHSVYLLDIVLPDLPLYSCIVYVITN